MKHSKQRKKVYRQATPEYYEHKERILSTMLGVIASIILVVLVVLLAWKVM